ncbi:hypothetical protein AB833_12165 [Chromatiales bacterium (ex Bugula neritina AB1)]|nr:hypothetical protein AB833_12165 [Chromatiales bacterium (ex Bugula neritina AB1)]
MVPPPFNRRFEKYNEGNNPGVAVMAIRNGEVLFKGGFGLANLQTGEKVSTATNFDVASVSKQFTAMAIAILAERGELSVDTGIHRFFPDLPDYMKEISVHHLIHHLSGLPDYEDDFESTNTDKDLISNTDIYNFYKHGSKLEFQPGKRFEYSNGGYILLAMIIELVSGLSYHQFMHENLFKPANMPGTAVYKHQGVIENRAISYSRWPFFENNDFNTCNALTGDGRIYTSIDDAVGWIDSLENNRLVNAATTKMIFSAATDNNGDSVDYGYGWEITDFYKHKLIVHSGGWQGFNSIIANFPKHNLWLVSYANCQSVSAGHAFEEMARHYLKIRELAFFQFLVPIHKPALLRIPQDTRSFTDHM